MIELQKNWLKNTYKTKSLYLILNNTIRLEYTENTGAFLSLGAGWSQSISFWVLSILPLFFLFAYLIHTLKDFANMTFIKMMTLILIISGGIGNITDRIIFNRYVTDFMNVGINNLGTGIFNFADIYTTTGILLLFFCN